MKKIIITIVSFFIFIYLSACTGYEPIFKAGNLNFKIEEYEINGNKKIGNQIYSKLYGVSRHNKNNPEAQSIKVSIKTSKEKVATVKNSAGKILEYKINLNTNIRVDNLLTDNNIFDQDFNYSSSYKVQDQHSETIKLENTTIKNLINKTGDDLIIKISGSLVEK